MRECGQVCRRRPSLSSPSAFPLYGWGSWDQTLLTSSKTSLLTVGAVVGTDADAFMVRKRLKRPVTRVCVCPSHAPFPLFYFALFLLLLHEGRCISPFSPPCTLAGEDGAVEAPGTLTKSCSEARGWEGCLLQAGGRKG